MTTVVTALAVPGGAEAAGVAPAPAHDQGDAVAAAMHEAKQTEQRVEIESLRDEKSTTWANPDGVSLRTELSSTPVHVLRNGAWVPVDTTLVAEDGVVRPKATDVALVMPDGGSSVVSAKHDRGTSTVRWPGTLPRPRLAGSTATYPDAVAPGADLVVVATATGFEQRIVLRRRPADRATFRVPVSLPRSMRYETRPDGRTVLLDQAGAVAAVLDGQAMADGADAGHRAPASVSVDEGALVVTPDLASDVSYPVTMAIPTEWIGVGLDEDTFVSNVQYPNSQASASWLRAGKSSGGGETWRSYLRFVVRGTALEGARIINADLRMWNYRSNDCGNAVGSGIVARRITTAWNPATLTWSTQPSTTTAGQAGNQAAYSDTCSWGEGELYYSIETIVQDWANGAADHGVQLRAVSESDTANWRQYRSSEYTGSSGRGPVLFVDYEPAPTTAEPFFIPTGIDAPDPTPEEMAAHRVGRPDAPSLPELSDAGYRALRENATDVVKQDADFGFYQPDDMTREEWLEDLDLPGAGWEPPPDTTAPVLVSTDPAADQTGVPLDKAVSATFDEPVTGATLTVRDPAGNAVAGAVGGGEATVTFTPAGRWSPNTTYTAQVANVRDLEGNPVAAPHTWAFTTGATSPEPVGLVAAYGMDEGAGDTVGDSSGNDNTGTADEPTWRPGRHGEALSFDGTEDSMVTVPDSPSLRLSDGMTISAWVRPDTVTDWLTVLMKDHPFGSAYGLYAASAPTPSIWLIDGEDEHTVVDGPEPLPTGTWTHLAATYDGSTVRLLVNGVEVAAAPRNEPLIDLGGDLHIGGNDVWGEFFQGAIDEVRVYNRAQTPAEVLVDMDTPVTPRPAAARAGVAAAPAHPYDHHTQDDCLKKLGNYPTMRHVQGSYSVCYTGKIGEQMVNSQDTPTGEYWLAQISVVVHSFVGTKTGQARGLPGTTSRQIKVYVQVRWIKHNDWPTSIYRPMIFRVNNSPSCDSDAPVGTRKSVYEWTHGPDLTVTLTSPLHGAAPEHRAMCGIQPSVFYPDTDNPAKRNGWLDNERFEFRCDSSTFYKGYKGGCVTWSVRPVWILDGNEVKSEETAAHIWKALYDPQKTTPLAPGQTKRIPGKINMADPGCAGGSGCLTRTTENRKTVGSVPYKNYQRATRECNKLDKSQHTRPSCDEFPFASTHEGGHAAGIHFSAAIVELSDNCSAGSKLNAWYRVNRILEGDPFWVDTVKKGQTPPTDIRQPDVTPDDVAECDLN